MEQCRKWNLSKKKNINLIWWFKLQLDKVRQAWRYQTGKTGNNGKKNSHTEKLRKHWAPLKIRAELRIGRIKDHDKICLQTIWDFFF